VNRLDPRVQLLWAGQAAVTAGLLAGGTALVDAVLRPLPRHLPAGVFLAVVVAGSVVAVARYRAWGYEVREDAIYLERGVFTKVRTVVPFVRIQHVDSSRSPPQRLIGLASAVVYTAGSRGADVTLPGLTPSGAEELRERLKRLAIRAEGEDAV